MRFTVRRPASAEVSPCCHRPSGGDVACGVHVGVARPCVAGFALENLLALAVSGSDVPAIGASLRRVCGRDLFDPTVSLVLQTRGEQTPTASDDATVEAALLSNTRTRLLHGAPRRAGHRTHIESFDADRVEAPRDFGAGLFDPVLALVGLTRLQLCDRQLRAGSPVRAALGAGQSLLQRLQPPGLTAAQARSVQQFAGGQCRRHGNTAVDPHYAALTRTTDGIRDVGERDMPASGSIAGDSVGLHILRDGPREAESHPANLGHPHLTEPAVQTRDVMRFDRDLAKSLMHTGLAPRRAAMRSAEKVAHRLREIPQRLLLHSLRPGRQPPMLRAGRGQLSALLVVARRVATRLPVLLLLDGQIPHIPSVAAMLGQHPHLLSGRKQPISRHTGKITANTDTPPKGEAPIPPAKARSFHAVTNR